MKYQNDSIGIRMLKTVGLVLSFLLGQAVWAQGAIESVTGSVQGGTEIVRIDLSHPLSAPPSGIGLPRGVERHGAFHGRN